MGVRACRKTWSAGFWKNWELTQYITGVCKERTLDIAPRLQWIQCYLLKSEEPRRHSNCEKTKRLLLFLVVYIINYKITRTSWRIQGLVGCKNRLFISIYQNLTCVNYKVASFDILFFNSIFKIQCTTIPNFGVSLLLSTRFARYQSRDNPEDGYLRMVQYTPLSPTQHTDWSILCLTGFPESETTTQNARNTASYLNSVQNILYSHRSLSMLTVW